MNNDNFNKLSYVSHEMIDNIQKLGHEFLNATLENSVPIINTFANTNLQTDQVDMLNYYVNDKKDKLFILCEVPGTLKENTKVNYTNNTLKISSKTAFGCCRDTDDSKTWDFVKPKHFYREIQIGCVDKESIKISHKDGCLYIVINKINDNLESNIEIN